MFTIDTKRYLKNRLFICKNWNAKKQKYLLDGNWYFLSEIDTRNLLKIQHQPSTSFDSL